MNIFIKLGTVVAKQRQKQALLGGLGKMLGRGAASLAKRPSAWAAGAGLLGLGASAGNEQLAHAGLPHIKGPGGQDIWNPAIQANRMDPTQAGGVGRSLLNTITRPWQSLGVMTGANKPSQNFHDFYGQTQGGTRTIKSVDPVTNKVIWDTAASEGDLNDIGQNNIAEYQRLQKMFGQMPGVGNPAPAAGAKPQAQPGGGSYEMGGTGPLQQKKWRVPVYTQLDQVR